MGQLKAVLERVFAGHVLTRDEARAAFATIVAGGADGAEIAALVAALRVRGEDPGEIAGAAEALRDAAVPFPSPADVDFADTCGTGGDGLRTVNLSTAAAFVAAELGVPVAKHGNRSVSSRCGSADVLERCGVALDTAPARSRAALDECGVCFLFAPAYHSGLRHAAPVRRALATRTVFNLLGPLVNPARPPLQVMGVFDPAFCEPLARTLAMLGTRRALVVHGSGLDELALHGPTTAAHLVDGDVEMRTLHPGDAGLATRDLALLRGGEPEENAAWLRDILAGQVAERAHAEAVAMNAGALAWLAGRFATWAEATAAGLDVIAEGRARARLTRLAGFDVP